MATTRRKKHNPRAERTLTRISGVREVKQTFLIICEGMNTEPDYFNAFRLTFPRQEQAIHRAKTVMKQFEENNPAQQESSTTVYLLVEELNRFL